MKIFYQNKRKLIINVTCTILFILFGVLFLKFKTKSPGSRYIGPITLFSILTRLIRGTYKDYKFLAKANDNYFLISYLGTKYEIYYEDIVSIRFNTFIRHFSGADALSIKCSNGIRTGIDVAYDNYLEFWLLVIDNAQKKNPNVEIHKNVQKRIKRELKRKKAKDISVN